MTALVSVGADGARAIDGTSRLWRDVVGAAHKLACAVVLGLATTLVIVWPGGAGVIAHQGGAALLVGGALIGVPHGTSDFVVAQRALKPTLGRGWLPAFLVSYLIVVALVLFAWTVAPLATLLAFIVLSALHFGFGDLAPEDRRRCLTLVVRATTPLLPVLLLRSREVPSLIASLGRVRESDVTGTLDLLRWPLVSTWGVAVACLVIPGILGIRREWVPTKLDAAEIGAIALAAVTLPPLTAFALYFCLVHAVRHMIDIGDEHRPHDARRAAVLVTFIVVPSALACTVLLALTWDGIAGALGTEDVLVWAIRLIAALTVPHMALDAWVSRSRLLSITRASATEFAFIRLSSTDV